MDRILSVIVDIALMISKFMNLWVSKMYGNNGTFYQATN